MEFPKESLQTVLFIYFVGINSLLFILMGIDKCCAILKNYTKREDNRIVLQEIQRQLKQFLQVFIKWIPESDNRGADQLARQALQQRLTHQ